MLLFIFLIYNFFLLIHENLNVFALLLVKGGGKNKEKKGKGKREKVICT